MLVVGLGWVLFRAHDVGQAFNVYAGMLGYHGIGLSDEMIWSLRWSEVALLMTAYFIIAGGVAAVRGWRLPALRPGGNGEALMLSGLFVLAAERLAAKKRSGEHTSDPQ